MPLDRGHMTIASRVMVWQYPLLAAVVGLGLLVTPLPRLLATPTFTVAAEFVSLRVWGAGFLVVAAALLAALGARHRRGYQFALCAMAVWMCVWSLLCVWSAVHDQASFSAWVWPWFVAAACWATLLSLQAYEF